MQDFVILFHEMPLESLRPSHWDLMLQNSSQLLTWACNCNPLNFRTVATERLPNHRLMYLEYEGEIGGNRGVVTRIAKGKFIWLAKKDLANWSIQFQIENGQYQFDLYETKRLIVTHQPTV